MSDIEIPLDTGDFRLMSRRVCDILISMKEKNRFIRGLVSWVGFKQTGIEYIREGRFAGKTSYSFRKLIKFSLDGLTSFSKRPLELTFFIGITISFIAFIYAIYIIVSTLVNRSQPGWASLIVVVLMIGGIQMIMLGVVGEYIARIYDESKGRPLYIVSETTNVSLKK